MQGGAAWAAAHRDRVGACRSEVRVRSKRPQQLAHVVLSPVRELVELAHELVRNALGAPREFGLRLWQRLDPPVNPRLAVAIFLNARLRLLFLDAAAAAAAAAAATAATAAAR